MPPLGSRQVFYPLHGMSNRSMAGENIMKVRVSVSLPRDLYDRWLRETQNLNLSRMLEETLRERLGRR